MGVGRAEAIMKIGMAEILAVRVRVIGRVPVQLAVGMGVRVIDMIMAVRVIMRVAMYAAVGMGVFVLMRMRMRVFMGMGMGMRVRVALDPGFAFTAAADCTHGRFLFYSSNRSLTRISVPPVAVT